LDSKAIENAVRELNWMEGKWFIDVFKMARWI
jgi:hypothetical protein